MEARQRLNFTERESRAFRRIYDRYSNALIENREVPIEFVLRVLLNFERIVELGRRPYSFVDRLTMTLLMQQNLFIAHAWGV